VTIDVAAPHDPAGSSPHAIERAKCPGVEVRDTNVTSDITRDIRPRQRPLRDGSPHDAGIREQFEIVSQPNVARRKPGIRG
jgi:hypothetical protein